MITIDIPDANNINSVADWVELNIALTKAPISKAELESRMNGDTGDETSDAFISSVWDELDARMVLYGNHPPFTAQRFEITPNLDWETNPEYLMFLLLSLTGNPSNPTPTGKLFERISKEAIKNYINGEAIVFGHPSMLAIKDICDLLKEKFQTELPPRYNDRGVDVIAWKPFGDNRGNQIIMLVQCAGGANWTKKTGDVTLRAWVEKYILFGCRPVRGFTTVAVITNKDEFEEISFETDLLFDRPRLYRHTIGNTFEDSLRDEVKSWCDSRIEEIIGE